MLVIASISAATLLQLMIVNGLANIPLGSLRATPILLSPMSSPKLRVVFASRLYYRACFLMPVSPTHPKLGFARRLMKLVWEGGWERLVTKPSLYYIKLFTNRRASSNLSLCLPPAWAKVALPPPPPPVTLATCLTISPAL